MYWQGKAGLSHSWQNGRCSEEFCSVFFKLSVVGVTKEIWIAEKKKLTRRSKFDSDLL
jgi:hypothetical protein